MQRVRLTAVEHDRLDDLRRRAHSAATLASTAAACASPLLASSDLRASLLAADVCAAALGTLRGTTAVVDGWRDGLEPAVQPRSAITPVPPDTPKLLPAVHLAWAPTMAALRV